MERQVDVVIVNYNAGDVLCDTVKAVLASTGVEIRVFVVDNASRDNSLALLEALADERIAMVRNPDNRGFARASNQGIHASRAPFVLLLNPDCRVEADAISGVVQALETHSRPAGMGGCLILNPDGSEQRGARRKLPRLGSAFRRVLRGRGHAAAGFDLAGTPMPGQSIEVEAISGAFMLVRREAVEDVGLLDEGYFLHCEDLDWCRRFHEKGWSTLFVPDARCWHQQGHSSSSRPVRVLWYKHRGMWRYYVKFDAESNGIFLAGLVWLAIHLRAALLSPLVALRLLKP